VLYSTPVDNGTSQVTSGLMNEKQLLKTAMRLDVASDVMFHALRFRRVLRDPIDFLRRQATACKHAIHSALG
jgi:hypothetical protein